MGVNVYTVLPENLREVDVIVVGGGTSGCTVSARLAEADPKLKILLIEQGINNHNVPEVIHPALYPRNLHPNSKTAIFYKTNKAPELNDREAIIPGGGCLGGGSSINWMVYTRGQRSDFDNWNTPGWSANDLYPFLKKFETYHGQGEREHHGYDGPIHVSSGTYRAKEVEDQFIEAADKMGYPELKDLQNLDNNNATERWLRYVGPDGLRQDAAHRYIHPKLQSGKYPNLHVLVETEVIRILFDNNKRAVGVEYRRNPKSDWTAFQTGNSEKFQIKASKMVVSTASAIGTPLLLQRSGVGDPEVLKRAGIETVEALPDVGKHYQDHHLTLYAYRTNLSPQQTVNAFNDGRWDLDEAVRKGDKIIGWNGMDASGKFRPTEEEVDALGPEFREAWDRDFKNQKDRPLMIFALYNSFFGDYRTLPDGNEYITLANWTAYPYSRGHVHPTGPMPSANQIDFDNGYLKDKNAIDLKKHIWAYKIQREMFRRMSFFRGELPASHPDFPKGSKAAVQEHADGPVPNDTPRIQYTKEDDAAIEKKIREIVSTTWHALGTARMAPREKGGCVDPSLNVYGIKGLKLADLSIPPGNVGANTNNTAFLIGEKAADIIIKELGLNPNQARL